MTQLQGRVLVIAGSDSGGGAGIQADVKTITALGSYAMTAVTAVTAQDTRGVHGIETLPPGFVMRQVALALDDIGADVVKTGMLGDSATIEAVAHSLVERGWTGPLVVDPVMIAKGGAALLAADAVATVKRVLLPLASLVTPNIPEAEALTGMTIEDEAGMRSAADAMLTLGVPSVLLKGGHLRGDTVIDVLATEIGIHVYRAPRIETRNTHGTGCTLASAIASGLAQGRSLPEAIERARRYLRAALRTAPGLGHGHGPLNHAVTVDLAMLAAEPD